MAVELTPLRPAGELLAPTGPVATYVEASLAPSTRRAYASGLRDFESWAAANGWAALPASPETVASYLADLAERGRKVATIEQRAAAIRWAHEAANVPNREP